MRKIDFTCKRMTLKDLVQCNYNLNDSEYLVFSQLIVSKRGLSVKDLIVKIKKDRTTVQKILTKLISINLILKKQVNLDRGFMFVYFSKNKTDVIKEIEENVESYFIGITESLSKWKSS